MKIFQVTKYKKDNVMIYVPTPRSLFVGFILDVFLLCFYGLGFYLNHKFLDGAIITDLFLILLYCALIKEYLDITTAKCYTKEDIKDLVDKL